MNKSIGAGRHTADLYNHGVILYKKKIIGNATMIWDKGFSLINSKDVVFYQDTKIFLW